MHLKSRYYRVQGIGRREGEKEGKRRLEKRKAVKARTESAS